MEHYYYNGQPVMHTVHLTCMLLLVLPATFTKQV